MSEQVAPSAARTVCVDLDATIIPWGPLNADREPFPGAVEAMRALRTAGWRIVILTSRWSPVWWADEVRERGGSAERFGAQQKAFVFDLLARYGVPYDAVTAEKVPAAAYFDDKAITISEAYPLVHAIADFMEAHR